MQCIQKPLASTSEPAVGLFAVSVAYFDMLFLQRNIVMRQLDGREVRTLTRFDA